MNNNVTKPKTINGYKIDGNHVILTPTQFSMFESQYEQFGAVAGYSEIEQFVCDCISNALKAHNVKITSMQVGSDKTGSNSDVMNMFLKKIDEVHKEFVSNYKGEIFSIDGKYFWLDGKNKLREFSPTFTARTPEGYDSKSYQKHLLEKAKKQGLSLNNEAKEVVESETNEVDEVVSEI